MPKDYLTRTLLYYQAMDNQDFALMETFLAPNVQLITPMGTTTDRQTLLVRAKEFRAVTRSLDIRAQFCQGNQVVLIYDVDCIEPIGMLHAAGLITFEHDLIASIEIFIDPRPILYSRLD